jgi:Putative Actinobacterial Holin-X, holin superfamily III
MMAEAPGARPATAQDSSTSELVKQMSEQVTRLVRDELRLAQLEMTRKGKRAGLGVGAFGGGGILALYGIGCLLAAAIIGLATVVAAWLAALIIGAGVLIIAAGAALFGRAQLSNATPPVPQQAAASVKEDVQEIRESAHR